jgi:hypothetical protein
MNLQKISPSIESGGGWQPGEAMWRMGVDQ